MDDKQRRLVMELEQQVRKRFPTVEIEGYGERDGKMVALYVKAPDDELADKVVEELAPWSVDTLSKTGYLVYVVAVGGEGVEQGF